MSRWRPPRKPASRYITPAGRTRLADELQDLWRRQRPEVVAALAAAAAEGDRSENAEYTYRRKQLGGIDSRIRHLRRRLDGIRVVDTVPADTGRVFFGAWVLIEDDDGTRHWHRIVGPDETAHAPGYISMDAPLGHALLGQARGSTVAVKLPAGERHCTVLAVRYTGRDSPPADGAPG